jgi:hypothetical protein
VRVELVSESLFFNADEFGFCIHSTSLKAVGKGGARVARTGLLNLLYGLGNFCKIWSACRQEGIKYIQQRMNKYVHNFTCVFFYTSCAKKIQSTDNNRQQLHKNVQYITQSRVTLFLIHFYKMN